MDTPMEYGAAREPRARRIRVLSLDLDGTVIDRGFAEHFWMEFIPKLYAELRGIDLADAKRQVYSAYDEVGPGDVRWYMPEYWLNRFGIGADPRALILENVAWMRIYPDAEALLGRLNSEYTVIASTNSARIFAEVYQEVLGIRFDATLSCVSDFGIARKNAEFYRRVAAAIGVDPREVLHVGDDPERDVEAAIGAGFEAYLIDRKGCEGRGQHCVDDLRKIADILGRGGN
ncbi:MAG: HAD family hydrolase [Conexivisphaera sp.]|jgi:putative hydrolase of the HAD superfamily